MGTREVYEQKLRRGNLHHDPTMRPGLGTARCPRCLSTVNPTKENSEWEFNPVIHDATAVAGSALGAMLSSIHAFNTGFPYVQKRVKGPKWLPFVVGIPPLVMFSAASAAFGGYAFPKFAQFTVRSYYATSSASHYGISLLTRHIEDRHISRVQQKELR
ncbi:hypothetical protein ACJIZ3_025775 [Penstemon smallii]|uniref:Transmembrane protein n=1 Tax=Penstemon smallii TaxID=265156 RepID=A0ABD3TVH5_9LAMI